MAFIITIDSMRLFRRGAYFVALTLPLLGTPAKAEVSWELLPREDSNPEELWTNVEDKQIAESKKEEDSMKTDDKNVRTNIKEVQIAEYKKEEDTMKNEDEE